MIDPVKPVAVLDACVLYPAPMRDLLLHLADGHLFTPKWTDTIQDEWVRNLLLNRPDLNAGQLRRTTDAMNKAFAGATVTGYEALIGVIHLPDLDDRHVLAAAIRCHADVIVTANLKDFPAAELSRYDVETQHPDLFIHNLLDLYPGDVLRAFHQQVANLRNPPKTTGQVLESLRRTGLTTTADGLSSLL
jgi:hypothetical protein